VVTKVVGKNFKIFQPCIIIWKLPIVIPDASAVSHAEKPIQVMHSLPSDNFISRKSATPFPLAIPPGIGYVTHANKLAPVFLVEIEGRPDLPRGGFILFVG
jgi:hypothetical protein